MGGNMCKCKHPHISNEYEGNDENPIDPEIKLRIEEGFEALEQSDSPSLIKKYLTKEVFDELKKKSTLHGGTLLDVMQSVLDNLDSEVGIYAPDAESYTVFAPLFDKIIEEYHDGFTPVDRHPTPNYGGLADMEDLKQDSRFVLSIHLRAARNIQGYPFNSLLSKEQYSGIETRMFTTLGWLEGAVAGEHFPLAMMPEDIKTKLYNADVMIHRGDRFFKAANGCSNWPSGRGVYFNADCSFVIWVNQEDHLRIIVQKDGADLAEAYGLLADGLRQLDDLVDFCRSSHYGFMTFNPTELGTGLRVTVRAQLPRLCADLGKLVEKGKSLNLVINGTEGEEKLVRGGVVEISNKRTLGIREITTLQEVSDGIKELVKLEIYAN